MCVCVCVLRGVHATQHTHHKNIQFTAGHIKAIRLRHGVHKNQKAMWNKIIQVYGHLNFQVGVPYIFPI